MQKYILVLLFYIVGQPIASAQSTPSEKQLERYKEEAEKQQQEYITNFLSTLKDVDDFQKHIIKQKMESFFEERAEIFKSPMQSYQKKDAVERLKQTHFKDIETTVSEETMSKILEATDPNLNKIKAYKKHKRKNKKN